MAGVFWLSGCGLVELRSLPCASRTGSRNVAPSSQLRKWFSHDPAKWDEFRRRYFAELNAHRDVLQPLLEAAKLGKVTLVYSSHDQEHNNAVALKEYLESKLSHLRPHRKQAA